MARMIDHTTTQARHPWPDDVYVQGGEQGIVMRRDSAGGSYKTAFVEAFPEGGFVRGEGPTLADAEDAAWAKYETWRDCDGTGQPHGPFEARGYANGCGHCTRCGTWMTGVLPAQPADPDRDPNPLEKALLGDDDALGDILGTVAHADELPDGPGDTS
ncbi:hypothetical protein AB0I72_19805 [Nocardiopsis sp. NPDC049922]|uniref:hypothetical protein n=1 Tax=Nocardiopsis sp. NPDC049922 TaxID=3155157 RepID=UPI0033DD3393